MTTASESINPGGGERRLHPWSWLFVLIQQVKAFALPLLVLLFTGRGNSWELWGLAGGGVLVLVSLLQYFFYRFRVEGDGIVIRSGVLQKSHRHIPYQRVHNVAVHQSLLHRLFGVAEVRLESAGGMKPEAEMRVLSLVDAQALEELVRAQGAGSPTVGEGDSDALALPESRVLLALSTGEVVRLGLISNRGLIAVAAAFGLLAQADMLDVLVEPWAADAVDWGRNQQLDWVGWIVGALALLLVFVVALRVLSVVLALLQFHGFTLTEQGRRLSAQRGLLTRLRANMPRSRIQAWSLREGLLHRWFGRQSLRVDSASVETANDQRSLRDLAPVATPETVNALIRHLLPVGHWPMQAWRRLHHRAWRRQFTFPALLSLALTGAATFINGPVGLAALLLVPLFLVRAIVWARHAGWSEEAGVIAVREGWLDKRWRFAEVRKIQSLVLVQSPIDRYHGMASLLMDTVGASPFDTPLRIRYLPADEAMALRDQLAAAMEAAPTPARTPA
ncbi:membrane protein [Arenimonas soli]|uniref:Membrane protein n=1 Tax=Arenimonas soli TaxID=2269504 RepID=A0ABQ1HIE1_9GAMM|nr:PH domain-containing protein [Arenimonas soli]GGA79317.1 membrane protein [Arenimonas soli]